MVMEGCHYVGDKLQIQTNVLLAQNLVSRVGHGIELLGPNLGVSNVVSPQLGTTFCRFENSNMERLNEPGPCHFT